MILKVFCNINDSMILNRFSTCERCQTDYLGHAEVLYLLIDTIIYIDLATESLCEIKEILFY